MSLAYTEMGKIGAVAGNREFCFGRVKLKKPTDTQVERSNSRLLDGVWSSEKRLGLKVQS